MDRGVGVREMLDGRMHGSCMWYTQLCKPLRSSGIDPSNNEVQHVSVVMLTQPLWEVPNERKRQESEDT